MYIPFVFEHILYTVDKYFSQLVAFCTNNFSFDAYGMFLSVYFQNCIIDTRVDGMDINRTGNFSVHFGTVKIKSVVSFCPESIEFTVVYNFVSRLFLNIDLYSYLCNRNKIMKGSICHE